jgi:hypothetical protein
VPSQPDPKIHGPLDPREPPPPKDGRPKDSTSIKFTKDELTYYPKIDEAMSRGLKFTEKYRLYQNKLPRERTARRHFERWKQSR